MTTNRRQFLQSAIGGSVALGGGLSFLGKLAPVSAAQADVSPGLVRLDDGIEPAVRLLEETPRDRVLEEVAHRVQHGMSYREVLTALLLAGVRNVQPRPAVGFKFHAVLVINSAHLASLASPDTDRWLPIFWAIDRFKSAQAETKSTSGWRMSAADETRVPSPAKARQAFIDAMESWDEQAADAAAAGLARACGRNECFELFARFGCRDFRDIGHKAIYVSNSFRTLECIGWHHAEPVLRSLAYALMKYDGENPARADHDADRPWRHNLELAKTVRRDWTDGRANAEAATHLLTVFRKNSPDEACAAVAESLNQGVAPQSICDAMLSASSELLMRQPGIATLHSVTSSNALRFAYETVGDANTRLMLLLQNAAFVSLFRQTLNNKARDLKVDEIEPDTSEGKGADAIAGIFAEVSRDRLSAARKALAYLQQKQDVDELMHAARRMVFLKGNDAHDYKFSSAVLEDYRHISPPLRDQYLAAGFFYLPGSGAKDNALVTRIRDALR